ncbi:hypothetical protein ACLMJK_001102 [Lecanora helva]
MESRNQSQSKLTLYRGFENSPNYVWSPFVNKLEARLRFGGLPYILDVGAPPKAPRGKIPYIFLSRAGPDGQLAGDSRFFGDSTLISQMLVQDGWIDDLNADLSPVERAHDLALKALLEDKLYFYQEYEKWMQNYYKMRNHVLWALPYPMKVVIGYMSYRKETQMLYGQGTSRFSAEEIKSFTQDIWKNINELLFASRNQQSKSRSGGGPFWILGGNQPSEVDTTVFGFVVAALVCESAPNTKEMVRGLPVVVEYAKRIHERYFPDYTPPSWGQQTGIRQK